MFSEGIFYVIKKIVGLVASLALVATAAVTIAKTETRSSVKVQTLISVPGSNGATAEAQTQTIDYHPQVSPDLITAPLKAENWDPVLPGLCITLFVGFLFGMQAGYLTYPIRARGFRETVRRALVRSFLAGACGVIILFCLLTILAVTHDVIPHPKETIGLSQNAIVSICVPIAAFFGLMLLWCLWAIGRSITSEDNAE